MAEVVAFVSSVTAVIQISGTIISFCKHYIETAGDAPSDFHAILVEVSTLKTIFETLEFLTKSSNQSSNVLNILSRNGGPIEECHRSITELEKLFPQNVQSSGQERTKRQKIQSTFAALAWPLKETKARKLLDEIVRQKSTVSLALTTDSLYVMSSRYYCVCVELYTIFLMC